jgi:hypothetical protein
LFCLLQDKLNSLALAVVRILFDECLEDTMSENMNFARVTGEEREKVRSLVREHAGALAHLSDSCHTILFRVKDTVYFVIELIDNELGVLRVENPIYSAESDWDGNIACGLIAIYDILDFFEESIDEIRLEEPKEEKQHLARFMMSLMILIQSVEDQVFDIMMMDIEEASKHLTQKPKQNNHRKTRRDLLN